MKIKKSNPFLFAPCGFFIFLNFLSAFYVSTEGRYNGDFWGIPIENTELEIWLYAIIASLPYLFLYFLIKIIPPSRAIPKVIPKFFILFCIVILILTLILTVKFDVGKVGEGIYTVPSILKPFVVFINRIDPAIIVGLLILSPYVKFRIAILVALLLIFITLYRASLLYIPYILIICFYRYFIINSSKHAVNKAINLKNYFLALVVLFLITYFAPEMYKFRESLRDVDVQNYSMYQFIFGKLIGRLSNLSALLMFEARWELYYQRIDELQHLSFLIDSLKYFWGGFIKTPIMTHYDYFTLINDPDAYGKYSKQTGIVPALGLSMMKSAIISLLDVIIIISCVYFTVKLTTSFLGKDGKFLAMVILVFATLSGAPNQFSLPVFHLIFIFFIFLFIKNLTLRKL